MTKGKQPNKLDEAYHSMDTIAEWRQSVNADTYEEQSGYIRATSEIVKYVVPLLDRVATFEELKAELQLFCKDRMAFLRYARRNRSEP